MPFNVFYFLFGCFYCCCCFFSASFFCFSRFSCLRRLLTGFGSCALCRAASLFILNLWIERNRNTHKSLVRTPNKLKKNYFQSIFRWQLSSLLLWLLLFLFSSMTQTAHKQNPNKITDRFGWTRHDGNLECWNRFCHKHSAWWCASSRNDILFGECLAYFIFRNEKTPKYI